MANFVYTKTIKKILDGELDLSSGGDTIHVLLLDGHTPDPDDEFISDVVGDEISVSGYSRQTLGSQDTVEDLTNDLVHFEGADVTFTSLVAGADIGHIVLAKDVTNDADSPLLCHIDVVSPSFPEATDGSNFVITWDSVEEILQMLMSGAS